MAKTANGDGRTESKTTALRRSESDAEKRQSAREFLNEVGACDTQTRAAIGLIDRIDQAGRLLLTAHRSAETGSLTGVSIRHFGRGGRQKGHVRVDFIGAFETVRRKDGDGWTEVPAGTVSEAAQAVSGAAK